MEGRSFLLIFLPCARRRRFAQFIFLETVSQDGELLSQ